MKIIFQLYGERISVENDRDDLDVREIISLLRLLMVAAGYSENNIDEHINLDE